LRDETESRAGAGRKKGAVVSDAPNSLSADNWQVCDDFLRAWEAGQRPSLDAHLARCGRVAVRADVLWNLLEIEVEQRGKRGETPRFEDYQRFTPEFLDVLRRLLPPPMAWTVKRRLRRLQMRLPLAPPSFRAT
jgi:hypothetical protein